MNEREIFEDNLCHKLTGVFNTSTNQYEELIDQLMWEAWQASAKRENFRLVPVVPTEEMLEALDTGFEADYEGGSFYAKGAYKTMIGVVDEQTL